MKKSKSFITILITMLISLVLLVGCNNGKDTISQQNTSGKKEISTVHFIDTGNSDSILIENSNEFALIDGGDLDDDEKVVNYLKQENVSTLKYVIISHPHADHIGALDTVLKEFKVENLIVGTGVSNTKSYEAILREAKKLENMNKVKVKEGEILKLGSGELKFYNTEKNNYKDLNNKSLVVKYSNGEDDFLLMGDAEREVELDIRDVVGDVEVLKVGHHGSSSSTKDLLEKIKVDLAVITCGENNKYGHPHKETMNLLNEKKIQTCRSDLNGDIIVTSSGNGITLQTQK